jgi:hypothetical protein
MALKLSRYINDDILVSIPALFDDGKCRAFTLVGVELNGLWLQSDELAERLLHSDMREYQSAGPLAFIPFAQIAAVLFATRATAPPAVVKPAKDQIRGAARAAAADKTAPKRKSKGA